MTGGSRLDRWLRPEVPAARFAAVRLLVGTFATIYLVARVRYFGDFTHHRPDELAPVGICSLVLRSPLPGAATWSLALAGILLGGAFALGRGPRRLLPIAFALVLLWLTSYASSWGKILHSENLLVWHVALLALASGTDDRRTEGWALRAASIATVLTYALAAITKLRLGGGAWLSGQALGDWLAFDSLRKIEGGSLSSPLAAVLAAHPVLLVGLAGYTLLVELGAPLALLTPRGARVWIALAWLFHVGILLTMAIGFFYPLSGVAFASLVAAERLPVVRRALRGRLVQAPAGEVPRRAG